VDNGASLSIRNDSDCHVTIQQADVNFKRSVSDSQMFEVCVPPGAWIPYGWADPQAGSTICVAVGTSLSAGGKHVARMNLRKVGQLLRLPDNNMTDMGTMGEVILSVQTSGSGRMLRIVNDSNELEVGRAVLRRGHPVSELSLSVSLSSIGVSLVVEKPILRYRSSKGV